MDNSLRTEFTELKQTHCELDADMPKLDFKWIKLMSDTGILIEALRQMARWPE